MRDFHMQLLVHVRTRYQNSFIFPFKPMKSYYSEPIVKMMIFFMCVLSYLQNL